MNGIKVEAHNKNQKYFTTIEIEEGDTLWEIAKENRTEEYASIEAYIDEVKRTNHLESDQIEAGYSLLIPYYASEPRE
ncbi:MAG: LysM peptidoglycan-binding domain-containing protein [Lachnospiraceae bacterium]|nr:LysM peptidoglycan-binding domain-containing protein [Lachnospiraceae bacterium]